MTLPQYAVVRERDVFGAQAVEQRRAGPKAGALGVVQRQLNAASAQAIAAALAGEQVHRRRADELGDELGGGTLVDYLRRVELLDAAGAHHGDAVAERHGLDLVMRDVDRGRVRALVQQLDLGAHLDAQLGVQVGQRFVEQEQLGVAGQRTAHRDALALAAGQRAGLALQQVLDLQHLGDALHRGVALGLRYLAHFERKGDVAGDTHVRIQRVALEHHRDIAVLARHVRHVAATDVDAAGGGRVQPGHHVQQRRLATARGADQDHEFAGCDLEVDVVEDHDVLAVHPADVADRDSCHRF